MAIPIRKYTPPPVLAVTPAVGGVPSLRGTNLALRTAQKSAGINVLGVSLPTEKNTPSNKMEDYCWLIYGPKLIGKTSLAAQFPGALILEFEQAARHVSAYKFPCPSWAHLLRAGELLSKGGHEFKTVVIDTGFEAYSRCMEHVCAVNNIQHPGGQNDYGASWKKVSDEFRRIHMLFQSLGITLTIICHEKLKECETRAGQRFDQTVPNLPGQADDFYRSIVDNIVYYNFQDHARVMTIRGSDFVTAGIRSATQFLTPSGEKVISIQAGDSAEEAFQNLTDAFYNRSNETGAETQAQFEEEELARSMRKKAKEAAKKAQR